MPPASSFQIEMPRIHAALAREAVKRIGQSTYRDRIDQRPVRADEVDEGVAANKLKAELGLVRGEGQRKRAFAGGGGIRKSEVTQAGEHV
jgi:hypothetical protein